MLTTTMLCIYFITTPDVCATYRQVVSNKPTIELRYAQELSKAIVKASKKYNINPYLYTAILMQESGYSLTAVNKKSADYGISQINHRTITAFKFDKRKLISNLHYAVEAGAIVLSDFKKRHGKKEVHYWTRYNTSHPGKRLIYKNKVLRFY
jgi:soluble lytic murein transglycosylase-like protein